MPMFASPKAVGFQHMVATKSFLVKAVMQHGASQVLTDWSGTDDEAIKAIYDDPREVVAMGCDHYDEKGYCLGHVRK